MTITPSDHLVRIYNLLIDTYGEPKNEPDYDPLGGLIGTIPSQHTSDINRGRAYLSAPVKKLAYQVAVVLTP
jgi:endonuclease III